jgi:hypothetical protein
MTEPVPTLLEIIAGANAAQNLNLQAAALPQELIDFMQTVNGNIPLQLAAELRARFMELNMTLGAMHAEGQAPDVAAQFIVAYQDLQNLHAQATLALQQALQIVPTVGDQAWRAYLMPVLAEAQEQVEEMGNHLQITLAMLQMYAPAQTGRDTVRGRGAGVVEWTSSSRSPLENGCS